MSLVAIRAEKLSKKFFLGERGYRSLRECMAFFLSGKSRRRDFFWALDDVSFEVKRGEIVGVIGPNGAGKSTLLKLIARVSAPSRGGLFTRGRIGALIELTAGFHHELTGRENIYFYGSIMGMKKRDIDKKFLAIVDFSELKDFLDTPLKRYSSGMKARLGFAISIHIEPDILLIDEVLSVGDLSFQEKCLAKMEEYRDKGVTIIFVSHNFDSVSKICTRAILLRKGRIIVDGDTERAIGEYFSLVSQEKKSHSASCGKPRREQAVAISDIHLANREGRATPHFRTGDEAFFSYKVFFRQNAKVFFNFLIWRNDRLLVYDTSQYLLKKQCVEGRPGDSFLVKFRFSVNLLKGIYYAGTHVTDCGSHVYLDVVENAASFIVCEDVSYGGVADLNADVEVSAQCEV